MVNRRFALPVVALVAVSAAAAPAWADHSVGVEQARKAVRTALVIEFDNGGGLKPGSLDLTCKRDAPLVRCGIRMRDRRDRRWCGHSSVRPAHAASTGKPITITHYNVRMANCGAG